MGMGEKYLPLTGKKCNTFNLRSFLTTTGYFYFRVGGEKKHHNPSQLLGTTQQSFLQTITKTLILISVVLVATSFLLQSSMLLKCFININCSQINCIKQIAFRKC